jgi:hypothetical protein
MYSFFEKSLKYIFFSPETLAKSITGAVKVQGCQIFLGA